MTALLFAPGHTVLTFSSLLLLHKAYYTYIYLVLLSRSSEYFCLLIIDCGRWWRSSAEDLMRLASAVFEHAVLVPFKPRLQPSRLGFEFLFYFLGWTTHPSAPRYAVVSKPSHRFNPKIRSVRLGCRSAVGPAFLCEARSNFKFSKFIQNRRRQQRNKLIYIAFDFRKGPTAYHTPLCMEPRKKKKTIVWNHPI